MEMKTTLAVLLILELYGLSSALVKQHYYVNMTKTWDDARLYCRTLFHDLSSFTNSNEEQQFMDYADRESDNAWIGLHKVSGVWKWSGGENATLNKWSNQMFQGNGEGDCAFLKSTQSFNKLDVDKCNEKRVFFCMTRFVLVQQTETWEGALEYCRKSNYDLASLNSLTRMISALPVISQAQTEFVWTGLRFLAGKWFWVAGGNLNTAWSVMGQPECPASNLRCGALGSQTKTKTLRDCEEKLSFICQ